ncbi:hypothetical protein HAZT_HAZT007743 [Hyalella azteca]|uniref:Carbohydrate sulfotransferase n=1 Tax=Hyalella azteca TaxID=294128 RepID=A0A6A0HBE6_HYAAZ|nr:hypothetical protein HAZT_HAZT007743 [Hyalella azteca]
MFLVNSKPQGPETGQEILDEQSHLQSEFENLSEPVDNRYNNIILDDEKARASTKHPKTRKSPSENTVLSESPVLSSEEMLKAEEDFALRRKRMRGTCVKYGLGKYRTRGSADSNFRYPPSANYDVLYIDRFKTCLFSSSCRKDGLTYCPVYKAASTSWLHNLCVLAGADPHWLNNKTLHISTVARRFWPQLEYDVAASVVPGTLRFMIVRHPFDRLISAYRDKLENINVGREHGVLHFHESYGKKIVHKYRLPNSTVQQFLLY